jgi:hypothetical protein
MLNVKLSSRASNPSREPCTAPKVLSSSPFLRFLSHLNIWLPARNEKNISRKTPKMMADVEKIKRLMWEMFEWATMYECKALEKYPLEKVKRFRQNSGKILHSWKRKRPPLNGMAWLFDHGFY